MPGRGSRGSVGYTFDVLMITPKGARTKIFELRSKSGGHDMGVVRWSSPHRAYVYTPSRELILKGLTNDDLDSLREFVWKNNVAHAERAIEVQE